MFNWLLGNPVAEGRVVGYCVTRNQFLVEYGTRSVPRQE